MYNNKAISLSDCDATNFELEQAVLESSLESFRSFEHGRKQASSSPPSNGTSVGRMKPVAGVAYAGGNVREGSEHPANVSQLPIYLPCPVPLATWTH